MKHTVFIASAGQHIEADDGANLLTLLRQTGCAPEAPCGGHGKCGKCRVEIENSSGRRTVLACQTPITENTTVYPAVSDRDKQNILSAGCRISVDMDPIAEGYLLAFDIGTTTVVCYLLDGRDGSELANASMQNPQSPYGADVISRIQCAMRGEADALTKAIRAGMEKLIHEVCRKSKTAPEEIGVVSVVGNPCMQQLFLGIPVDNLAKVPFAPVLRKVSDIPAAAFLSSCVNARLLIIPDISGYVGADTLGCLLATGIDHASDRVLMVDIGTNGEMALSADGRIVSCSTAAGPALEGARIRYGMRGTQGAIDHITFADGKWNCHVIGGGNAAGICGSGLIDAVAGMKRAGIINRRGRIQTAEQFPAFQDRLTEQNGERIFRITDTIYLTQQDIREVQMAKGAIAAGIELMAGHLGLQTEQIDRVLLAGAFGSFMNSDSACEIGLLPSCLKDRITVVGNAAGSGAKMLACSRKELDHIQNLVKRTEFIELASLPQFQHCFARNMNFTLQ